MAVVGVGVAPVGVGFGGATPSKERDSGEPSGGSDGSPGGSALAAECRRGVPGFRAVPEVPPGRMASVSAAKVPQSRRAGAHRAAGGFAADLPRRAGAGRGFSGSGRAYRRQKSVPGRAPRGRRRPNPDTIRTGSVTAPRFRSRGPSFAVRVALPYPISTTHLGRVCSSGEAFGFASTGPENLRPSTRHRDLHRPIHTDINKTAKHIRGACPKIKQHNNTITKHQNNTTTQQQNRTTGNQKVMNSGRQDFSTSCRLDFRTSVSTEVSTEFSHSVSHFLEGRAFRALPF